MSQSNSIKNLGLIILLLFFQVAVVFAQSDPTAQKRVSGTYVIQNINLIASPGSTPLQTSIVIKDGLIVEVGSAAKVPLEAQIIKGDSLYAYPAFIDAFSTVGVTRPADPERPANFIPSQPSDEIAGITPWRQVLDYYDASNNSINDWRKLGFAIAHVGPEGGMIPGKTAIVTYGGPNSTNIITRNTALIAKLRNSGGGRSLYPGTTLGVMAKFRDVYKNTELSAKHDQVFASTSGINRPERNKTYEAMYPVINKQIPVLFEVNNDLDARRALMLQKELGFKLGLVGLQESDNLIDEIKRTGSMAILSLKLPDNAASKAKKDELTEEGKERLTRVEDAYQRALGQAASFEKEGVPFAFASVGIRPNDFMKNLELMIKAGLSEKAALAALTTNPASMLGISRFAGTVEKGKLANLILSTGPLFTENTQIKHVIADGFIFNYEIKTTKKESNGNGGTGSADLSGSWEYISETPAGSGSGMMEIKKEGSSYVGTITYDSPTGGGKDTAEMKNITFSNNELKFSFGVSAAGMSLDVNVSGLVDGSNYSGSLSIADFGSFPLTATKKPNQLN
ncbi:amidohydrolase family protein [Mongoliitalea daihaiensis]|nr:amidohydrolase family protein [Mongoliitalea daihaiensis]